MARSSLPVSVWLAFLHCLLEMLACSQTDFFFSNFLDKYAYNNRIWLLRHILMLSILGKNFSRRHFEIFFLIFPWKQALEETICMKGQSLFSGKIKKNIIYLSSAELVQWLVKVSWRWYTFRGAKSFQKDFTSLLKRDIHEKKSYCSPWEQNYP